MDKISKKEGHSDGEILFFDPGVVHTLCEVRHLEPHSDLFGRAFEQFIACELRACLSCKRNHSPLKYWRSKSSFEVDFIIGDKTAIEVKSSKRITLRDHKGLLAISEENNWKQLIIVSRDPIQAQFGNKIQHLHWKDFLTKLWEGVFF